MELLSLVIRGMEQEETRLSVMLDYKDICGLKKFKNHFSISERASSDKSRIFIPHLAAVRHVPTIGILLSPYE